MGTAVGEPGLPTPPFELMDPVLLWWDGVWLWWGMWYDSLFNADVDGWSNDLWTLNWKQKKQKKSQ